MINCRLNTTDGTRYYCDECDPGRLLPLRADDRRNCTGDLTPLLTRLAKATNHPEIIDQPQVYGRAVQVWAAGIPDTAEPFEARDDAEVEFCESLCRENVCKKFQRGFCRPSCGQKMLTAVKARMASESCPWIGNRW